MNKRKMGTPYQEIEKVVVDYGNTLSAYSFDSGQFVEVKHCDGSHFMFASAFALKFKDYYLVFTEHHKYHIYHVTDVDLCDMIGTEIQTLEWPIDDVCDICSKTGRCHEMDYTYYCPDEGWSYLLVRCADCYELNLEE